MLATLIRLLGDFDRAEEAMADAFATALDVWPRDGLPDNARAWLVSTGRFKAIDRLRRSARFDAALAGLAEQIETSALPAPRSQPVRSWRHKYSNQLRCAPSKYTARSG